MEFGGMVLGVVARGVAVRRGGAVGRVGLEVVGAAGLGSLLGTGGLWGGGLGGGGGRGRGRRRVEEWGRRDRRRDCWRSERERDVVVID